MRKISKQSTENTLVNVRSITSDGIFLSVLDCDYFLSYDKLPWFRNAKVSEVFDVKMLGEYGIRWDVLDIDLEIDSLKHPEKYPLIMKRYPEERL